MALIPHHWKQRHRALLEHRGRSSRCGAATTSGPPLVFANAAGPGARTGVVLGLPANGQHDRGTTVGGGASPVP
jgi:hypothetical protein